MSFTATASIPVTQEAEADIINDGWFPDVIIMQARELVRIDGTITAPRLRAALVEAVASVNDELSGWKNTQQSLGHAALTNVPSSMLDGISRLILRYERAVYALAKANLVERYRDYDSSNDGTKRADEIEPNIDALRRDYRWAISDMLGIGRNTIELI